MKLTNDEEKRAKEALDKIINKSRVHFYKPIQIAEILYKARNGFSSLDINNLRTYRNNSKQWRDEVSLRLVGRVSTSSQKFQDNLFEDNAMPPSYLAALDTVNRRKKGIVENYIYHKFQQRMGEVQQAYSYLSHKSVKDFNLNEFLKYFEDINKPGLKRSVDKAFEIVVYALFSVIVDKLQVEMSLEVKNPDEKLLADFESFLDKVLGLKGTCLSISFPANMYRGGVTNAADRGLDIITNFGPAVQIKHLTLNPDTAQKISDGVTADNIVVVCKTAEAPIIETVLQQLDLRIKSIITQSDLEKWYDLCLTKYPKTGEKLLENLKSEFCQEFPILGEISRFLSERSYDGSQLTGDFAII